MNLRPLPAILALAFVLRLIIALSFQNVIAFDEVFQFLEQAHRLVFGQGIVPWEFQVGLRSWFIPLLLAVPMELAHLLFPNPLAGLILIRLLLCIASLPIVWCATRWGDKFYGPQGAWIAGLFIAFWPDLWLFAPHPIEEVLAADLLLPAIYLIGAAQNLKRVAWAGFLLGVIFVLREQLAPAIAIAGILLCGRTPKRWYIAVSAAALPVLAAGALDWFTWGQPFRSFWLNIYLNMNLGIASQQFGANPLSYFVHFLFLDWLWTLPVILLLAWLGARKLPLPGIVAAVIIITHCLIAHKEYRFIFPAIALIIPLAGLGLADLVARLQSAGKLSKPRIILAAALLAGPLCSPFLYFMLNLQTSSVAAFEAVAKLHPKRVSVPDSEGNFIPIDLVFTGTTRVTGQLLMPQPPGPMLADVIVAIRHNQAIPPDFNEISCRPGNWIPFSPVPRPELCIYTRPATLFANPPAPGFEFPFPKAARPFIIRDRLTDK